VPTNPINKDRPEPIFVNLLRSLGIYSQPGGIDSWSPYTFKNTDSVISGAATQ
jgi:hypothetical protein